MYPASITKIMTCVIVVENCGMDGERLFESASEIAEDAGYYSLIIAKDREEQ